MFRKRLKMLNYLNKISDEAKIVLKDLNVDKAFQNNETIKIAVTGLNRTGKTLFITSLINQIISGKNLKILNKDFKAEIIQEESETPKFKYRDIIEKLRKEPPEWPKSTNSVSKIVLKLEVKSESSFFPNKILFIEIVDYPGEWLFDIAMHGKSFEEWSASVFEDIKEQEKRMLSLDFQSQIQSHDLYQFSNGVDDEKIVESYRKYQNNLIENGYSLIQPGRSFQSGNLTDRSVLLFTPLLKPQNVEAHEDSIYNRFKKRYDKYLETSVTPLAIKHFSEFDRQIVLVDVLKSLQNGYNSFIDMTKAVKRFTEIYKYGRSGKISKLINNRRIDKILFVATKSDSIPSSQIENYKHLLDSVVEEAQKDLRVSGIETKTLPIASVKNTNDIAHDFQGKKLDCVKGKVLGKFEESIEYVGEIPESFPRKKDWKEKQFSFPEFAPITFPDRDIDAVQNINIDKAIQYLIEDKL
jgi:predicted YcjX-like family ATPase